jgi:hypothetical protein
VEAGIDAAASASTGTISASTLILLNSRTRRAACKRYKGTRRVAGGRDVLAKFNIVDTDDQVATGIHAPRHQRELEVRNIIFGKHTPKPGTLLAETRQTIRSQLSSLVCV